MGYLHEQSNLMGFLWNTLFRMELEIRWLRVPLTSSTDNVFTTTSFSINDRHISPKLLVDAIKDHDDHLQSHIF